MDVKKSYELRGYPNPYVKGLLGVSFTTDVLENLGETQLEILHNLCVDYMTVKEIAKGRQTSQSAVKNIIYKLRQKTLIDKLNRPIVNAIAYKSDGGGSSTLPPQNKKGLYRVHGQNHTIKLLATSKRYFDLLNKKSSIIVEDNIIMIYRRKIVIYGNISFYDDIPDNSFEKSHVYWHNFFIRLEKDLGVKLYDGIHTEIKRFRCHIAKTNDPLAKIVIGHKLKYKYIDDLGRSRLEIDNSKGLMEFEAICSETCQEDINIIRDFQGDLITKEHYLPSDIKNKIDSLSDWSNNYKFAIETQTNQHSEVLLMLKALTIEVTKLKRGD